MPDQLCVERQRPASVHIQATRHTFQRCSVLQCLQLDAGQEMQYFDTRQAGAGAQVPMGMVNLKRMANVAKHYRSRFTTIVGIQPTGWTHSAGATQSG